MRRQGIKIFWACQDASVSYSCGASLFNRQLVRRFIDVLIGQGATQLLFVSHHAEDAPQCITHRLSFVPDGEGGYGYQHQRLEAASV